MTIKMHSYTYYLFAIVNHSIAFLDFYLIAFVCYLVAFVYYWIVFMDCLIGFVYYIVAFVDYKNVFMYYLINSWTIKFGLLCKLQ
jgi:hypothetical protein